MLWTLKLNVSMRKLLDTLKVNILNLGGSGFRLYDGSDLKTYLLIRW